MPGWQRTRVYRNHHLDSTRWDAIEPRDSDVVITTSYKSGTTWAQHIVGPARCCAASEPAADADGLAMDRLALPDSARGARVDAGGADAPALPQVAPRRRRAAVSRDDAIHRGRARRPRRLHVARQPLRGLYRLRDGEAQRRSEPSPFPRFDGDVHKLWRDWISRGYSTGRSDGYPVVGEPVTTPPLSGRIASSRTCCSPLQRSQGRPRRRGAPHRGVPRRALADDDAARVVRESHIDRMRGVALEKEDMLASWSSTAAPALLLQGHQRPLARRAGRRTISRSTRMRSGAF